MPFFPPTVTTESQALSALLRHQCLQLRTTALGLTTEQAREAPLPSALSIAGLLIHGAQVIHGWLTTASAAPRRIGPEDYAAINARIGLQGMFSGEEIPDGMPVEEMVRILDSAIAFIDEAAESIDLERALPQPVSPWLPEDFVATGRWVWLHLITEMARHAGHADLIREALDGKISYELNFLSDGGTPAQWAAQQEEWAARLGEQD